ncbi:hypothetical protein SADUNF_Sadunf17G0011900 [Salix dunnii]|uniref:Uncharacterized protein n=1 Tax=Salix dunnii TaxID=1413687 RepID=A0A835MGW5_9ROSI|nr:hypothetical protein SADUNF_Sadunf17G0011900 [Salix dunnii]
MVETALKLKRSSEDETIVVRWEIELHQLLAQEGAIEHLIILSSSKPSRIELLQYRVRALISKQMNFRLGY